MDARRNLPNQHQISTALRHTLFTDSHAYIIFRLLPSRGKTTPVAVCFRTTLAELRDHTPPFRVMSGNDIVSKRAHYSPPWADVSIIGIAGSSGSGKSTLSHAIVSKLNLPWVVILSMVNRSRMCM